MAALQFGLSIIPAVVALWLLYCKCNKSQESVDRCQAANKLRTTDTLVVDIHMAGTWQTHAIHMERCNAPWAASQLQRVSIVTRDNVD